MPVPTIMNEEVTHAFREVESAKARLREAIRRAPPQPLADMTLRDVHGTNIALSDLFEGKQDLLLWHNMGTTCDYCTLWADGLRGYIDSISTRAAFALTSPDEPGVLKRFAEARGWTMRCVSAAGTDFLKTLKMTDAQNRPMPGISALHRQQEGVIVRTAYTYFGPGDDFCLIWPAFDLLKDGPNGWQPRSRAEHINVSVVRG